MMGKYKEKTWQRFSRRGSDSMSKGCKKYQKEMNVVLDTSGSMGKDFEKALSYVFFHGITMNMVQCDTEVKKVSKITSLNQLKKEKIVGLGGTTLSPALDYIATDKKMRNLPTLILTDGYTDTLRVNQLSKQCLILSNGVTCPVDSNNKVKQIIIDKEVK
jgi:predicted metal-dependent peptidase